jgi:hypothetical protein
MELRTESLCRIIQTCAQSGVLEITLPGGTSIRFRQDQPREVLTSAANTGETPSDPTPESRPGPDQPEHKPITEEEKRIWREEQLELLKVEHPAEYERLLAEMEGVNDVERSGSVDGNDNHEPGLTGDDEEDAGGSEAHA